MRGRGTLCGLGLCVALASGTARAEDFYIAPDGSDAAAGDEGAPFATLAHAQDRASPGDTVHVRGGTYAFSSSTAADGVVLDKSGLANQLIHYVAYKTEVPVFDFSGMTAMARITGLRVTGSYIHVEGLEITGVPQRITTANESWGIYNTGSHNVYERLNLHHISGPGLFIGKGSDNLVLNCDSHDNYDPLSKAGPGENADGFGCHGDGTNNVFRGCRAWWNTDDGYDFISALGVCTVENSWAFYNGYMPGTFDAAKNGNGFKAGGYGSNTPPSNPPRHIVRFCLAFKNRAAGFYANHHPIGGDWFNNTGYANARDFDMLVLDPGGNPNHKLRNNLGFGSKATIANFTGNDDSMNSWTLGVSVTQDDFESIDTADVMAPRKADGSLPEIAFMKLRAGSDLIDKGEDIGFPYVDAAPDLGAFEFGAVAASMDAGAIGPSDAGAIGGAGGAASRGTGGSSAAGTGGRVSGSGGAGAMAAAGGSAGASIGGAASPAGSRANGATSGNTMTSGGSGAGQGAPSGCTCRAASGSRSPRPLLALLAVAGLARRRRRP